MKIKDFFIYTTILTFLLLLPVIIYPQTDRVPEEKKLAGINLGITRDEVIKILGEPEEETQVVGPSSGISYLFMGYKSQGILVVIEDSQVSLISIFSPCKAKTSGGLSVGDKLSAAKDLYGSGIKESMGESSKFIFPDYNLSIKGAKGTVIITEISIGKIDIY